jgi:nicotinate phosphoribosyltransferase
MEPLELRHPSDREIRRTIGSVDTGRIETLLEDVIKDGRLVYEALPIDEIRKLRDHDLDRLDPGVKRLVNPHIYHVSLTPKLWQLKRDLVERRGQTR